MKTALLYSASLACALLATQLLAATDVVAGWNAELNLAQQAYNQGTDGRARADAILRAALDAARNGVDTQTPPAGANLDVATAQAAYSVLSVLYPGRSPALDVELAESLAGIDDTPSAIAAGREWGRHVAEVALAEKQDAVSLNATHFAEEERLSNQRESVPVTPGGRRTDQATSSPGHYRFTVLAGSPGTKGYVDGKGAAARFDYPGGIAVDALGNVYVSEQDLGVIRKISADGTVTTLAGLVGAKGLADGFGTAVRFNKPTGLAVDGAGNVYVADTGNRAVRKIDYTGKVTTSFIEPVPVASDGTKQTGGLEWPTTLTVDDAGNVFFNSFIQDTYGSGVIRKIASDGSQSVVISDLAFLYGQICVDHTGKLYLYEEDGWDSWNTIFIPAGVGQYVSTEMLNARGWLAGVDAGNNLYLHSYENSFLVDRIAPDGGLQVGLIIGEPGTFNPAGLAADKSGKIFAYSTISEAKGAIEVAVSNPNETGPVIIRQPEDHAFYPGGSASFEVQAAGWPSLTYQWYFNSTPIGGANSATLYLGNAAANMVGSYSVVVSDGTVNVSSQKVSLALIADSGGGGGGGDRKSTPDTTAASGGGSFDQASALAVLLLFAATALRRRIIRDRLSANRWLSGPELSFPLRSGDSNIAGMANPDTKDRT